MWTLTGHCFATNNINSMASQKGITLYNILILELCSSSQCEWNDLPVPSICSKWLIYGLVFSSNFLFHHHYIFRKKCVQYYRQTSDVSCTSVGIPLLITPMYWSIAYRSCSTTSSFPTPGFNRLGKDNCKSRRETSTFWNLIRRISEVWRYLKCLRWICT